MQKFRAGWLVVGLLGWGCGQVQDRTDVDAVGSVEAAACQGVCCGKSYGFWCDGAQLALCSGFNTEYPEYRVTCAHGCEARATGEDDVCAAPPTGITAFCQSKAAVPGWWCKGDALVHCTRDGVESFVEQCAPASCRDGGYGRPDYCAQAAPQNGCPQPDGSGTPTPFSPATTATDPRASVWAPTVRLDWCPVAGATQYGLQLLYWDPVANRWVTAMDLVTTTDSFVAVLPRQGTSYAWIVTATTPVAELRAAPAYFFAERLQGALPAVTPRSPGSVDPNAAPVFSAQTLPVEWTAGSAGLVYDVELERQDGVEWAPAGLWSAAEARLTLPFSTPQALYRWRVRARSQADVSAWSGWRHLRRVQ